MYFETSVYAVDMRDGVPVCVVREGEISDTLTIQVSTRGECVLLEISQWMLN